MYENLLPQMEALDTEVCSLLITKVPSQNLRFYFIKQIFNELKIFKEFLI